MAGRPPHEGGAYRHDAPGAQRTAGGRGPEKKKKRLLPILLALLALIALIVLLLLLLGGDDSDEKSQSSQQDQAQGQQQGSGDGRLTSGGTALLPVPSGGLSSFTGKQAKGENVRVVSVVESSADASKLQGFFVGTSSRDDRVYIEYGSDVGQSEATFEPKEGDRVNLTGPVRPAPRDPAKELELDSAEAELVKKQGAFVNADRVERVN